ncbi:hypothetical protein GIB67_011469 [Kingdonia uniflora]|uniref:Uncharacterized protein n=1 Tax=Kingdonia uniflora TaxID=39325 RepID=A0A7J7NM73_9MAGN|nr:hypothetical protein GIB67_011469 [Kingdonia uniflora]
MEESRYVLQESEEPDFQGSSAKVAMCFGASAVSGFFAAVGSLPFDYVKTQIQKMQPNATGKYPDSRGPFKFYTGFSVYCIRIAPHVMEGRTVVTTIHQPPRCSPLIAMNPTDFLLDLANGNLNDVSVQSELDDKVKMENLESEIRNGKPSPMVVHEFKLILMAVILV